MISDETFRLDKQVVHRRLFHHPRPAGRSRPTRRFINDIALPEARQGRDPACRCHVTTASPPTESGSTLQQDKHFSFLKKDRF